MVNIAKLNGAGNSFLILDIRDWSAQKKRSLKRRAMAQQYCDSHFSIGADGFIFLDSTRSGRLFWDFYNADGSTAEMCGNAARCVGRYITLYPQKVRTSSFSLGTKAGDILITKPVILPRYVDEIVSVMVDMPIVRDYRPDQRVRVGSISYTFDYIDSGVPHVVITNAKLGKDLSTLEKNVDKLGEIVNKIRSLTQFKSKGINVTFYIKTSKNQIHSLTFERGVREYTQACGTGAVAAVTCFLKGHPGRVSVRVPGGNLIVDTRKTRPQLKGPAQFIGYFVIERI